MSIDKAKFDHNDQCLNFDFDEWVTLSKIDPQAFEQRRLQWCNQLIQSAPAPCKRRLSGLLFQINMEKRRSSNPMDSCLRLSGLMWEKFNELRSELQHLSNSSKPETQNFHTSSQQALQESAEIIEFSDSDSARKALLRS